MGMIRILLWLFWQVLRFGFGGLRLIARLMLRDKHSKPDRSSTTTHGSARWARWSEIVFSSGMWGGQGIIIGKKFGRFLRFKFEGFVLVLAPTRSGKGVGIVIPNLLSYPGSVITNDCKGENYAITARDRLRRGPVYALNLIEPELSDGYNPLDMVRVGTIHEADDALEIAQLIVIATEGGAHWDKRATDLLQCLLLYTLHRYRDTPDLRNLSKVRSLISLGCEGLQPIFAEAATLGPTTLRELSSGFLGNGITDEARSIWSNADKSISLFSSDRPAGMVTLRSSFDMMSFNREVASLYLMIDETRLDQYKGLTRLIIGSALIAMTRAKSEAPPAQPTLFLIDEAAALGRLEVLESAVAFIAAYARMVLVFQDLDQIEKTYPKARSIIANSAVKVCFGVNDLETATMLASMIGRMTTHSSSSGETHNGDELLDHQTSQGRAETGRHLVDPSEIMRLPKDQALIFCGSRTPYPILAKKVRYYKVWRWHGRWDRWRRQSAKPGKSTARKVPLDLSPSV